MGSRRRCRTGAAPASSARPRRCRPHHSRRRPPWEFFRLGPDGAARPPCPCPASPWGRAAAPRPDAEKPPLRQRSRYRGRTKAAPPCPDRAAARLPPAGSKDEYFGVKDEAKEPPIPPKGGISISEINQQTHFCEALPCRSRQMERILRGRPAFHRTKSASRAPWAMAVKPRLNHMSPYAPARTTRSLGCRGTAPAAEPRPFSANQQFTTPNRRAVAPVVPRR